MLQLIAVQTLLGWFIRNYVLLIINHEAKVKCQYGFWIPAVQDIEGCVVSVKLHPQDVLATNTNSMDVEYAVSNRTEISCKNTVKCSENVIDAIRLKPAAKPLCIP